MTPVTLLLPYPVSANRYWRSYVPKGWTRALVVLSPEAKAFKEECGWRARAAGVRAPVTCPVALSIRLYPRDRRLLDIDNALKVVVDALKGIAYEDDKQVWRLDIERRTPDGNPRLELTIEAYVPAVTELEEAAA